MSDVSVEKSTESDGKKDRIVAIISSVVNKVGHDDKVSLTAIMTELRDLLLVIEETRQDLGMVRPTGITGEDIPCATDELDAIVVATSEATEAIMDCCDVIQEKAGAVGGENADAITAEVMKIFEACSFQDITGQRVSKVVKTFRDIEGKIDKLVTVLGVKTSDILSTETRGADEALMNGPQLAGQGVSQDDIDKLLAELDGVSD